VFILAFEMSRCACKSRTPEGTSKPTCVEELICTGMVLEAHKFSKFIHGVCALYPELCHVRPLVFLARVHWCRRYAATGARCSAPVLRRAPAIFLLPLLASRQCRTGLMTRQCSHR
jgi:hypothetical protein